MCGLAGIAVIGGELGPRAEQDLREMSAALAHRGPDGETLLLDDQVALAFRRLALVDPDGGDQPLFDESGSVALIANGEVYNHRELAQSLRGVRLRTKSDCEVLTHLYAAHGSRFLDQVRGMFAIVLHDRRRGRIVLARDRFGIKPLYFARVGNTVLFGSEIKALLQVPECPRELDWSAALADQSLHGAPVMCSGPVNCWFRGISMVPAGTIVTIDLADGTQRSHVYWRLPDFSGDLGAPSDRELIASYRALLADSVADCSSADAEVGLFLSGGVDSAAVAALAAAQGRQVHTFTVCCPSTVVNGDSAAARSLADRLGLPNHQVMFPAAQVPGTEYWKRLLWLLETPLCSPAQYYTYELHRYARRLRPALKGMMLGQASDEFNGGYSAVLSATDGWVGFVDILAGLVTTTTLEAVPALLHWQEHTGNSPLGRTVIPGTRRFADPADPYPEFIRWKYRDIQQYNCWHEDRTAAGNGIEARVPFLDHRVIELLATIPPARRARLLWDKAVLREAIADLMPNAITSRRKVSFYHDEGAEHTHRVFLRMLAQDNCALIEEALSSKGASEFLNPAVIRLWFADLCSSRMPSGTEFLLRLVNLGLLDEMTRQLPAPLRDHPPDIGVALRAAGREELDEPLLTSLCGTQIPGRDDVIRFASGVDAVRSLADESVIYLAVDGQFEYVVEAGADPAWFAFVRNVGQNRTLQEVLAAARVDLEAVASSLEESIRAGIIEAAWPMESMTASQNAGAG